MAKKRMFSLNVLETDAFMDLPLSAQALYFHLCMRADDDGFIGNPKRITQNIGASIDDLKLLIAKRFVLVFEDGVIVIKHWRMHNVIKSDRYIKTNFTDDYSLLQIKENGAYTIDQELPGAQMERKWITDGAQMAQTRSVDKNSIDIDKNSKDYSGVTIVTPRRTDERQIVSDAWNAAGISPIKKIMPDTKRDRMLSARIREYGLDDVLAAIEKVKESSFLKGKNDKGWTVTFDWFLLPSNFQKVLEGNYADTKPQGKNTGYQRHGDPLSSEMQEAVRRMLEDEE